MPKFQVESSETVFYTYEIEAENEEEAREIVLSGEVDSIICDSANYEIDAIKLLCP